MSAVWDLINDFKSNIYVGIVYCFGVLGFKENNQ